MWRQSLVRRLTHNSINRGLRSFSNHSTAGPVYEQEQLEDTSITCLMLHPVTWPNHGPQIELYLAEEAIGLVRSMDWEVAKGPLWKEEEEETEEDGTPKVTVDVGSEQTDQLTTEGDIDKRETYSQKRQKMRLSHQENSRMFKAEKIRDGDYVYGPNDFQGVYYKKGGLLIEGDVDDAESDMYDEWKNELIRESMAKSSLIRVRKVHSSTFFTKGKLNELGYYLKDNKDINVVFVNSTLTSLQQKKLEKRWNDIILTREDRLRSYYLKSAQKEKFNPTDVDSDTMSEGEYSVSKGQRKIRIIDRFGMILQIFASRAKTRGGQLQLELAWLRYARTMLVRGGAPTFGQVGSIFEGNMMRMEVQEVGIKSARGRGGTGQTGGEGETQLEMERRRLADRETKISKELAHIKVRTDHDKMKREQAHQTLPLIGLIGYTNAGKTALMNMCTGAHLESEDLLFQTLNTTHKKFRMPGGQQGLMLDTVGFITDLPHGLVESFKTTLEEIHSAELLVHVRDISHPHTNFQRDTVLRVLKEIGVDETAFENRYMEVWNKVDLVQHQEGFIEQLRQDLLNQPPTYPVVMMSCKTGLNKDHFLSEIETLTAMVMGKRPITLKYPYSNHTKVIKWLSEHANIGASSIEGAFEYEDETGMIILKVPIDDVTYQKYLKQFEPENFKDSSVNLKRGKGRLAPPPGWSSQ